MGLNAGSFSTFASAAGSGSSGQYAGGMQSGGAISSGIGAFSSALAKRAEMQGAADIADLNARLAETAAQSELRRGQDAVGQATARAGQIKGSQRAALAANGVDLGEGSAAEVLTSTDIMKEEEAHGITAQAVASAWGYRTQATNYQNQARSARASAKSISPLMAGASSLLGSGGQIASSWYNAKKAGGG